MALHAEQEAAADPAQLLRDELTIARLTEEVDGAPEIRLLDYDPTWWDGQAHTPCLVVSLGNGDRRRVVETGGLALVLPFRRRRAKRELAARRLPHAVELGVEPMPAVPEQRAATVIDATVDAVRCGSAQCGALRPVGSEACPLCGHR
jgi:hypothetical protein